MRRTALLFAALLFPACGPGASTPPAKADAAGPYPECPAVVQYLKDQSGDPDSIQVIKWDRREVAENGPNKGDISIYVTFRGANRLGGKQVWSYWTVLDKDGREVLRHWDITPRQ